MRVFRVGVAVVLCVFGLSASATAQQVSVSGVVTDDTKSALPGASITITNTATGVQVAAVTNARGEYRIQIPAGTYKLQAELTGFTTTILPAVEFLVGQNAAVPFQLKLAQLSEAVTVTAEAPLVDLSLGSAVERKPHVLEVDDRIDGFLAHHLGGILIN